jgi:hypothetical protein
MAATSAALLRILLAPLFFVEFGLDEVDAAPEQIGGLCRVFGRGQGLGALWSGCHRMISLPSLTMRESD